MKLTAKSNSKELLTPGLYIATIKSIAETNAKANDLYKDVTPQIEIGFETKTGFIRHWYNIVGFQKDANGNYAIDKDGKRIEDAENTAAAIAILERLALHAGIPENTTCELKDLAGMTLGIMVKQDKDQVKVAYTMTEEKAKALLAKAAPVVSGDVE